MTHSNRQTVCQELRENARKASVDHEKEVETWTGLVRTDEGDFIPGYIPYIGSNYFGPETEGRRILAYALSQNLNGTEDYAKAWARDREKGLDRQNIQPCGRAAMHPFDTGHIPILASLLRSLVCGTAPHGDQSIYREIAATNLSKFSFRNQDWRRTEDRESSLRCCWEWFSRREVELLHPNYIICCDQRVFRIVQDGLAGLRLPPTIAPRVLKVAFPSLQVINSHYHRKRMSEEEAKTHEADVKSRVAPCDLAMQVQHNLTIGDVIARDVCYFAKMLAKMRAQCQSTVNEHPFDYAGA
ncbi:MAG: hypothetical protein MUP47_06630 [Phycisphaerae bacterium]|nr:hypothetical protein [Phycisphaerae bacterium]